MSNKYNSTIIINTLQRPVNVCDQKNTFNITIDPDNFILFNLYEDCQLNCQYSIKDIIFGHSKYFFIVEEQIIIDQLPFLKDLWVKNLIYSVCFSKMLGRLAHYPK